MGIHILLIKAMQQNTTHNWREEGKGPNNQTTPAGLDEVYRLQLSPGITSITV